jgi:hypothetical protein
MKAIKFSFLAVAAMVFAFAAGASAQVNNFSDAAVDYSFSVPEGKWKMTVKPSATSPNVEYVYGDRLDGHLEVRRMTVGRDAILTDVVQEEEQRLRFKPGFVPGKQENFAGKLKGQIYNFEYVAAGKSMSGRYYFLKANDTTVYVLRFSGNKDILRTLRNETDSIARTFGVKN